MRFFSKSAQPQPLVGICVIIAALGAIAAAWLTSPAARPALVGDAPVTALVLAALGASVVAGFRFPVHINYHTKLVLYTTPLYLLAVLFTPVLATLVAGVALLAGELLTRAQKGTYASDIASAVGRSMFVVLVGSIFAHAHASTNTHDIALVLAALVMLLLDIVSAPLLMGPIIGRSPLRLMPEIARDSLRVETSQYLIGLLGAIASREGLWTLGLVYLPIVFVYSSYRQAMELQSGTRAVLESMADTVDLRDPSTGGHSRRVTQYVDMMLRHMGFSGHDVELILAASRVHDIGKIAIPDAVLNKAGMLDGEELAMMRSHAERGADVLARYPDFSRGVAIVRHHHEAWDGSGYPQGLTGGAIPFGARVIAVADSYDAMTSDRPYRRGMQHQTACAILAKGRGQQWDPQIIDAFLEVADTIAPSQAVQVVVAREKTLATAGGTLVTT